MSIREQIEELKEIVEGLATNRELQQQMQAVCDLVVHALKSGCKVLTCGNGGSTTDAAHLAEELIGRYKDDRRPLAALSLASDSSALTCIANDYGFEAIFERQVEALGRPGDVLVAFTTSGNSANVNRALRAAREQQVHTVVLTGVDGGEAARLADHVIRVPSRATARIQEVHTLLLHMICESCEVEFR